MPPTAATTTTSRAAVPAPAGPVDLPSFRRATARRLVATARQLAARPELWQPHRAFSADERHAARMAVTPDWEAWLLGWLPGQTTGLHDHGGSAGAFVVIEGALVEATLAPPRRHEPAALLHRTLDTGRHRSFGPHHVHEVRSAGDEPTVSLHVYAPALASMRRFVLDDDGRAVIVARERAGVDW
ncbi:MAG TPA: cysteine dioxygenase family protein [Actinomycetes bacterium]|nr:cysteine dioxygenase family protein [Actinomycetes bacterium]